MSTSRLIITVSTLVLSAGALISCQATPKNTPQVTVVDLSVTNQPPSAATVALEQSATLLPTTTPSLTPSQSPLPPSFTPEPQYNLGRFFIVADGEIYLATVFCVRRWGGCQTTRRRLTNTPEPEQQFAAEIFVDQITASPGGKKLAFAYRESAETMNMIDGGWDIYVLDVEVCQDFVEGCSSEKFTRLTGEPFDEISPAWAPDGSLIAYTTNQGDYEPFLNPYALFIMQPDGSYQTRLLGEESPGITGSIYEPNWSPDSQQLTFVVHTRDISIPDTFVHPDMFIYTASRTGTEIKRLTFRPHEESNNKIDLRPQWSPDGTQILFESNQIPYGLYLIDIINGINFTWIEGSGEASFSHWSPDGTMIAFPSSDGLAIIDTRGNPIMTMHFGLYIYIFLWIK